MFRRQASFAERPEAAGCILDPAGVRSVFCTRVPEGPGLPCMGCRRRRIGVIRRSAWHPHRQDYPCSRRVEDRDSGTRTLVSCHTRSRRRRRPAVSVCSESSCLAAACVTLLSCSPHERPSPQHSRPEIPYFIIFLRLSRKSVQNINIIHNNKCLHTSLLLLLLCARLRKSLEGHRKYSNRIKHG